MATDPTQTTASSGIHTAPPMPRACQWCGLMHGPRCPTVKAIDYHQDGTIKRVEFMTANDYPKPDVPLGGWKIT